MELPAVLRTLRVSFRTSDFQAAEALFRTLADDNRRLESEVAFLQQTLPESVDKIRTEHRVIMALAVEVEVAAARKVAEVEEVINDLLAANAKVEEEAEGWRRRFLEMKSLVERLGRKEGVLEMCESDGDVGFEEVVVPNPKRKRVSGVVVSDGDEEVENEDEVPIGRLVRRKVGEVRSGEDRVECNGKRSPARNGGETMKRLDLKKCEETLSDSRPARNGGKMLKRSNCKKCEEMRSHGDPARNGVETLKMLDCKKFEGKQFDNDLDIKKIVVSTGGEKKPLGWDHEADMLSNFIKDPELCLKAVCALYRQQISINQNGLGFNKLDAPRGSTIARFLLDYDFNGPMKRTVDDLAKYDAGGLDFCNQVVARCSKQLFSIYQNHQDPFFP